MWIGFLGWEDPPEEGTEVHSSILAGRIPWTEEPGGYSPWGHKESDTKLFTSAGQSIGASGSASVFTLNIQG